MKRAPPERLGFLAQRLHDLGPRPLFEYLREIAAGRDPIDRLEAYARLDPSIVHALGADRIEPFHVIAGGR